MRKTVNVTISETEFIHNVITEDVSITGSASAGKTATAIDTAISWLTRDHRNGVLFLNMEEEPVNLLQLATKRGLCAEGRMLVNNRGVEYVLKEFLSDYDNILDALRTEACHFMLVVDGVTPVGIKQIKHLFKEAGLIMGAITTTTQTVIRASE